MREGDVLGQWFVLAGRVEAQRLRLSQEWTPRQRTGPQKFETITTVDAQRAAEAPRG